MSALTQNAVGDTSLSLKSITDGANPRGIPKVKFIEDIEDFSKQFKPAASPEILIGAFSELFSKFKAYETNLTQKRMTYQQKLPEIDKTLNLVTHLKQKHDAGETIVTQYNLCDTVYAKAELDDDGTVNLWLGANVMLTYTYAEAIDLLTVRSKDAKQEFDQVTEDLAFTRNQTITAEVNMSRIYNWDVKQRRDKKAIETAMTSKA
jgi:prefoldin subunit 5